MGNKHTGHQHHADARMPMRPISDHNYEESDHSTPAEIISFLTEELHRMKRTVACAMATSTVVIVTCLVLLGVGIIVSFSSRGLNTPPVCPRGYAGVLCMNCAPQFNRFGDRCEKGWSWIFSDQKLSFKKRRTGLLKPSFFHELQ